MRTALIALASLAACTETVTTDPEEVAVDAFDGEWHKGILCDSALPGGETGAAPIPQWMPFSVARIDNAVIRWTSFDGANVLATHAASVVGGCLSVPAGTDSGFRHEAYSLCLDTPALMTGPIEWNHGTANRRVCDVTLRWLRPL